MGPVPSPRGCSPPQQHQREEVVQTWADAAGLTESAERAAHSWPLTHLETWTSGGHPTQSGKRGSPRLRHLVQ